MTNWQPIKGYEAFYEVSDDGQVRKLTGEPVGQWLNNQGYSLVRLSNPRAQVRVHRLVAEAFITNPDGKPNVNHIDCNRANNAKDNLEWCTQAENLRHSRILGRYADNYWEGKRSPNASLSNEQVFQIRALRKTGVSYKKIAEAVGSNKKTVMKVAKGETYAMV